MADIISSHKYEEERKSNVQAYMTNYFLHGQYESVNEVCNSAIDIIKSIQVKDQKGTLDKFFTFDFKSALHRGIKQTLQNTNEKTHFCHISRNMNK